MAAKHLEAAALIAATNQKQPNLAADIYELAAQIHAEEGVTDSAATALVKAAKGLDDVHVERGAALMIRACALLEGEDEEVRLRTSIDTFKAAVNFLVRHKLCVEAVDILRKQIYVHIQLQQPHGVARCELACVIILLAADKFEAAHNTCEQAMAHSDGFALSSEGGLASRMLDSFAKRDEESVRQCTRSNDLISLDNQLALLARGLSLSSVNVPMSMQLLKAGATNGDDSATSQQEGTGDFGELAPEDEGDMDEDDLC